jgi:hypothetical protein
VVFSKLIPTAAASGYKGANTLEALEARGRNHMTNNLSDFFAQSRTSSHLNPRFVAELMGFPVNWMELPFQNIEKYL